MAYDAATRTVLLFGGEGMISGGEYGGLSDTWSWNGATWTPEETAPSHSTKQFPTELSAVSAVPGGGFVAVGYAHTLKALVEQHP